TSIHHTQRFTQHALTSIKNFFQPNSISQKIQNQISYLQTNTQTVTFIWIPSHIGIPGNELADTCAKQSISSPHSLVLCSYSLKDSKHFITEYILKNWQHYWSTLRTYGHI
ncbi:RNA-directed DNA polymerase from mobile element jockey, partial [Aphis craccivora]